MVEAAIAAANREDLTQPRRHWLGVLAKASLDDLEAAWNGLPAKPRYRFLRQSETGLALVRGRIGGTGQPFNLGEMTMTRAAVQLLDPGGNAAHTGFGHVAGRSKRRAELVAVFDALLQDGERHRAVWDIVVGPLAARQQAARAAQTARVVESKVDFFTLVRGE